VEFLLRKAVPEDTSVLTDLIDSSVRELQKQDYTAAQIDGAIGTVFGVDSQLIADGTYFVVETAERSIVGCGGWSYRKTLYGSDHHTRRQDALLDPATDAARIRAFFVHPDYARRGIGTRILDACEQAAIAAGFHRFELGATLTGVKLYQARAYVPGVSISVPLPNGELLPVVLMTKSV